MVMSVGAQKKITKDRNVRFPVWITHSDKSDIIGLSLAAFPKEVFKNDSTLTRTYGVRLEASLLAVLSPLMPRSPVSTDEEIYQGKQGTSLNEIIMASIYLLELLDELRFKVYQEGFLYNICMT